MNVNVSSSASSAADVDGVVVVTNCRKPNLLNTSSTLKLAARFTELNTIGLPVGPICPANVRVAAVYVILNGYVPNGTVFVPPEVGPLESIVVAVDTVPPLAANV